MDEIKREYETEVKYEKLEEEEMFRDIVMKEI